MVNSDLSRQYKKGFFVSYAVELLMSTMAKSTEGGARTLVLAATTTPAENGKYVTHYQTHDDYKM